MGEKLQITKKKNLKGDDGYKTFSIRIKEKTAMKLEEISVKTNRSRNELINIMLEFGIENCVIEE
ncbi:MAG: BfmA/BtgA family mobilization protein [Oscillospiraceae bacterium]|nr:BfmA/BtgA family mobilization protein [Oscillospiraceae bacterium]